MEPTFGEVREALSTWDWAEIVQAAEAGARALQVALLDDHVPSGLRVPRLPSASGYVDWTAACFSVCRRVVEVDLAQDSSGRWCLFWDGRDVSDCVSRDSRLCNARDFFAGGFFEVGDVKWRDVGGGVWELHAVIRAKVVSPDPDIQGTNDQIREASRE